MAHAVDYTNPSDTLDLMSGFTRPTINTGFPGAAANDSGANRDHAKRGGSPQLERAVACEEHAQRLFSRVEEMEESVRLARMSLNASQAIEELLEESARLLEQGRQLSDPMSRYALAGAYREIRNQIDGIVENADYNGQNLAAGDSLEVTFDEAGAHILKIDRMALKAGDLGLSAPDGDFSSDADIIKSIMQVETALNTAKTRTTVVEIALSILESRVKFSRNKMDSLRGASRALIDDGKALAAIRDVAARRVLRGPDSASGGTPAEPVRPAAPSEPGRGTDLPVPGNKLSAMRKKVSESAMKKMVAEPAVKEEAATPKPAAMQVPLKVTGGAASKIKTIQMMDDGPEAPDSKTSFDQIAKELSRFLDQESYLTRWFKSENGESDIFTRELAQAYGPELIEKVGEKYVQSSRFREFSEKYMSLFEAQLEGRSDGKPAGKRNLEEFLSTDHGTVYIVLARASGRI